MQTIAQNIQTSSTAYSPSMENQLQILADNLMVDSESTISHPLETLSLTGVSSPETMFVTYPTALVQAFALLGFTPGEILNIDVKKLKEQYDAFIKGGKSSSSTEDMIMVMVYAFLDKKAIKEGMVNPSLPFVAYLGLERFQIIMDEFFDKMHLGADETTVDPDHHDLLVKTYVSDWLVFDYTHTGTVVDFYAVMNARKQMDNSMTMAAPASPAAVEYNRMNNANAQTAHLDPLNLQHAQQRQPGYFLGGAQNIQPGMGYVSFAEIPERIEQLKANGYILTDVEQDQVGGLVLYFSAKTLDSVLNQLLPEGVVTGAAPTEDNKGLNILVTLPAHAFPRGTHEFLNYWSRTKIQKSAVVLLKNLIDDTDVSMDILVIKKAQKIFGVPGPTLEDMEQPDYRQTYMKFLVDVIAASK